MFTFNTERKNLFKKKHGKKKSVKKKTHGKKKESGNAFVVW